MSEINEKQKDDIDIKDIFQGIGSFFRKLILFIFNIFSFLIKNWIIVLVLLIIGLAYGYFVKNNRKDNKTAQIMVRINFDLGNYVYNSLDDLSKKIEDKDSIFLKDIGLWDKKALIKKIEIEPIINFEDILDKYAPNNKNFEILFDKLEFSRKITVSETFIPQYLYHNIELILSENSTENTLDKLFIYINSNKNLENYKKVKLENMIGRIEASKKTIAQINDVVVSYISEDPILKTNQLVIDKDFTGMLQTKFNLERENEKMLANIALSQDILVLINKPSLVKEDSIILKNPMFLYPLLLIGLFLLASLIRVFIRWSKKISVQEREK